ncbi:MAG: hypothetical protein GY774_08260 [Planctomycetes bacterium]|nr:hypothetical protein [Planctomycetota bacterium]
MKQNSQGLKNFDVICISLLLMLMAFGLSGCVGNRGFEIFPLNNQNVLTLSSDDVVRVMRRAGFSDNQILQYGEDLHLALSQYGAAQIKIRKKLQAVYAINGDEVYISSALTGKTQNYIYNTKTGWVGGQ